MHIFRVFIFALVAFFLLSSANKAFALERRAIWIESEGKNRPFVTAEATRKYLEFLKKNKFTDIYLQVYREGRSWFPSNYADQRPYLDSLSNGIDPLRVTLDLAHNQGIRVHAWVNVLRVDSVAPIISRFGKDIVLEDNYGNSILDYKVSTYPKKSSLSGYRLDTPGVWLDPSSEKVIKYWQLLVREIFDNYPDLDGLHLDMIRFPFFEVGKQIGFPYNKEALEKFKISSFGKAPPLSGDCLHSNICADSKLWNDWRRKSVTELISKIKEVSILNYRKVEISAAVLANYNKAYNFAFQDWKEWVSSGLLDLVCLMNYNKDHKVFKQNIKLALRDNKAEKFLVGIGAWLFLDDPLAVELQKKIIKDATVEGSILFSYSNLLNPKGESIVRSYLKD